VHAGVRLGVCMFVIVIVIMRVRVRVCMVMSMIVLVSIMAMMMEFAVIMAVTVFMGVVMRQLNNFTSLHISDGRLGVIGTSTSSTH
jgi:hypothetical protein